MQKAHLVSVIAESKRFPRINISTSTSYCREKLQPLGLTPGHCWNGPTLFDSDGNVSGCQDPQVIPASLFDANGVLYLNSPVFPPPNVSGQDKNITSTSNPMDVRDDVVRTDQTFNEKWTILGHYMHDSLTQGNAIPFRSWGSASYNTITSTLSNPSYSAAIKLSGAVSPNLLAETSLNWGGYTVRPNVDGRMIYPKRWGQWFDTSKFSNVVPVWQGGPNMGFGSAAKDAVVGPGRLHSRLPYTNHSR